MAMRKVINVSINPTYYCNMSCEWCYLTPEQLKDRELLDLVVLEDRLDEISSVAEIGHVDIYGGEITLTPVAYQKRLLAILRDRGLDDINIVTNFTAPNTPILIDPDVTVSVSYDDCARKDYDNVFNNLLIADRHVSLLTLTSRVFLDTVTVDMYVNNVNLMCNVTTVEIKPYSSNQSNNHEVDYTEYERFVSGVIDHPDRNFQITNLRYINNALEGKGNSYSNDHMYITPQGSLAVLDFDLNDNEYFLPIKNMAAYVRWTNKERRTMDTGLCVACKYKGNCLSEHLKVVKDLTKSCNGFFNLLEEYSLHAKTIHITTAAPADGSGTRRP